MTILLISFHTCNFFPVYEISCIYLINKKTFRKSLHYSCKTFYFCVYICVHLYWRDSHFGEYKIIKRNKANIIDTGIKNNIQALKQIHRQTKFPSTRTGKFEFKQKQNANNKLSIFIFYMQTHKQTRNKKYIYVVYFYRYKRRSAHNAIIIVIFFDLPLRATYEYIMLISFHFTLFLQFFLLSNTFVRTTLNEVAVNSVSSISIANKLEYTMAHYRQI